jgi:hypothetical protein
MRSALLTLLTRRRGQPSGPDAAAEVVAVQALEAVSAPAAARLPWG